MHVGDRKRPPLSPQEGWLSDGRQVLHFRPRRYDRWSQSLEVTFGEVGLALSRRCSKNAGS
jgi:hypothetical protein